jgi:hypothetical protein
MGVMGNALGESCVWFGLRDPVEHAAGLESLQVAVENYEMHVISLLWSHKYLPY